jgi:hypothetical protein
MARVAVQLSIDAEAFDGIVTDSAHDRHGLRRTKGNDFSDLVEVTTPDAHDPDDEAAELIEALVWMTANLELDRRM